jgi:DNA-directed RNA polymerase specialized sigma24 family protein
MLDTMDLNDDDVALTLRYRDGVGVAFASLYARHKAPLYRYLLRHVRNAGAAADLFQDVWSRLIATRSRYEPRAKFATLALCGAQAKELHGSRSGRRTAAVAGTSRMGSA